MASRRSGRRPKGSLALVSLISGVIWKHGAMSFSTTSITFAPSQLFGTDRGCRVLFPLNARVETEEDKPGSIMLEISEKMREKAETEADSLRFVLADVKDALAASEIRGDTAEQLVAEMTKDREAERTTNKELVMQLRSEFENEWEKFSDDLRLLNETLQATRVKAKEDINRADSEVEKAKKELFSESERLQLLLETAKNDTEKTREEMSKLREDSRKEVDRAQKDASKIIGNIRSVTMQEKRELVAAMWDLESTLNAMELKLIESQKEVKRLEAGKVELEETIIMMQEEKDRLVENSAEELQSALSEGKLGLTVQIEGMQAGMKRLEAEIQEKDELIQSFEDKSEDMQAGMRHLEAEIQEKDNESIKSYEDSASIRKGVRRLWKLVKDRVKKKRAG